VNKQISKLIIKLDVQSEPALAVM